MSPPTALDAHRGAASGWQTDCLFPFFHLDDSRRLGVRPQRRTDHRKLSTPRGARRETSTEKTNETTPYIMALLAALQVQSSPNATLIIAAFIAFTAALYCVPMLFRFIKSLSNPTVRLSKPADDTVYTCHDEAFLHPRS